LCRELTKQFETVATLPAADLSAWLGADAHRVRGEFVLVVHAAAAPAPEAATALHDHALRALLAALPLKQAVALAAELTGAPRNALYQRALSIKGGAD
jgi:16S rRNA (cytidine1402-2'-O)-methyltransferase